MTLILNASPVIVLAKAGLIDRFLGLADAVIIPDLVAREVCDVADPRDPARLWMEDSVRQTVIRHAPEISPFVGAWDLGRGESAVISLAEKITDGIAVLDDLAARRCAHSLGLRVVGTLGLILMAKKQRLIPSVRQATEAIVGAGLFIAPRHIAAICKEAGE